MFVSALSQAKVMLFSYCTYNHVPAQCVFAYSECRCLADPSSSNTSNDHNIFISYLLTKAVVETFNLCVLQHCACYFCRTEIAVFFLINNTSRKGFFENVPLMTLSFSCVAAHPNECWQHSGVRQNYKM